MQISTGDARSLAPIDALALRNLEAPEVAMWGVYRLSHVI